MIKLGVNIDHFATLRNARKTKYPSITEAAKIALKAGADLITVHLREDRRHITDSDVYDLIRLIGRDKINLEIAATAEMAEIVNDTRPDTVCIVPEKRDELTTEGGLNLTKALDKTLEFISKIQESTKTITLFLDPSIEQITIAIKIGIKSIEMHTGKYAETLSETDLNIIKSMAMHISSAGVECNAGHGLTFETAYAVSKIQNISTLHIGHFIVAESLFIGLEECVKKMKRTINLTT